MFISKWSHIPALPFSVFKPVKYNFSLGTPRGPHGVVNDVVKKLENDGNNVTFQYRKTKLITIKDIIL